MVLRKILGDLGKEMMHRGRRNGWKEILWKSFRGCEKTNIHLVNLQVLFTCSSPWQVSHYTGLQLLSGIFCWEHAQARFTKASRRQGIQATDAEFVAQAPKSGVSFAMHYFAA